MTLIEEQLDNQKHDYSKANNIEDQIINSYYLKTKNLTISSKADLDNLLSDENLISLVLDE